MDTNRKGKGQDETFKNLIRYGKVSSVNPAKHTVRVVFADKNNTVSHDLPVLTPGTLKNKFYCMPDIGEDVVCIFLPNGMQRGFVIGSFYPLTLALPVISADKTNITFPDETVIEYDRTSHTMNISVKGDITINAISGDVIVNGVSLVNHTHGGIVPGPGSTAPPNKG